MAELMMKTKSKMNLIFKEFLRKYPRHFAFLFILLVLEGAASVLSILAIVPLADFLMDPALAQPSRITHSIIEIMKYFGWPLSFWGFGILFVTFNLLKGLMGGGIRYAILRIKYGVTHRLFGDALATFFRARWEFFSESDQGKLLNTLNKELTVIGDTLGQLATLLAQVVQLCIYLTVPLILNPVMSVIIISLAVLVGLPFLLMQRINYRLGRLNTETANHMMSVLSEILQAARLILGFGRQDMAKHRYLNAFDKHVHATLRSQMGSAVSLLFQPLAMLTVVIAIGFSLERNTSSISELAAIMWSLMASLPILASILQANLSISNFLPSYEQLIALRDKAAGFKEIEGEKLFKNLEKGIELKNVDFTYTGRLETLHRINLKIQKGRMTALVGESGSGKSTIVDLVLGLQIPSHGQVLLDSVDLREWKQNSFRQRVGYVPQDAMLFHASVRDNLLWAFETASEDELWAALRLANAENFVRRLPSGIDTVVGDRGMRLSGGERQRIALARSLLRKPELLILDEATSALDSESEHLIQRSIEEVAQDTTILIIAHRLSTISKSDQVYVLKDGSVIEEGAFQELSVKQSGILKTMLTAQASFNEDWPKKVAI